MKRRSKHSDQDGMRSSSLCAAAGAAVSVDGLLGAERVREASIFTAADALASVRAGDRRLLSNAAAALGQGRQDLRSAVAEVTALSATLKEEVRELKRLHTLAATLQEENARLREDLARRDTLAPLIRDLIAVVDATSRLAGQSGDQAEASPIAAVREGLRAIEVRAVQALGRYGVRVSAVASGDRFDPCSHDIESTVPSRDPGDVGRVAHVHRALFIESGGRTVRPALVSVFAQA